jgi:hypothetical protein
MLEEEEEEEEEEEGEEGYDGGLPPLLLAWGDWTREICRRSPWRVWPARIPRIASRR